MRSLSIWIVSLSSLALLLPGAASATPQMQMDLTVEHTGVAGENEILNVFDPAPTGPISRTLNDTNGGYDGTATAYVDFGVLRGSTQLSVPGALTNGAAAGVGVQWRDTLTMTAPGQLPGSAGMMDIVLNYEGELSGNPALAGWGPNAIVSGLFNLSVARGQSPVPIGMVDVTCLIDCTRVGNPTLPTFVSGTLTIVDFAFQFEVPIDITVRMNLLSGILTDHSCGQSSNLPCDTSTLTAGANFMNTVSWGGVSELRDAGGGPLVSFSALGSTGLDYSRAIPEPSIALLLGAGVLGAGIRRRARAPTSSPGSHRR